MGQDEDESSTMKKVLMISYLFPPMAGGGVQRSAKFAKYLPQFGWKPHVLTTNRVSRIQDKSLLQELSSAMEIYRTRSLEPTRILARPPLRGKSFVDSWLFLPDDKIGWIPFALKAAAKIIRKEDINVVFSTSGPYTSHLIGYFLKKRFKIPWIADFRDPWSTDPDLRCPTIIHRYAQRKLEKIVVQNADSIITVNEPLRESLIRSHALPDYKVSSIPNGYDAEDFEGITPRAFDAFTIVYTGSFYAGRSPRGFFEALHEIMTKTPELRWSLKFIYVGSSIKLVQKMAKEFEVQDLVKIAGYLSHKEALSYVLGAHILLLVVRGDSLGPFVSTGKIYEYLYARKPLLALAPPESPAAQLIKQTKSGTIVRPSDVLAIKDAIYKFYNDYQNGNLETSAASAVIEGFNRKRLTRKLAEVLNSLCADSTQHRDKGEQVKHVR